MATVQMRGSVPNEEIGMAVQARSDHEQDVRGQPATLMVVTTDTIMGQRIRETKGEVFGLVVRSRGLGGNIMAGLRSLGGGEIFEYTELLEDARRHAIDRMIENATAMGANAIVRMQFDSSEIGNTMTEIVAYGTAVVVEPE